MKRKNESIECKVCGLEGLHDVRPQISKQKINLKLPQYLLDAAQNINEKIGIKYENCNSWPN